MSSRTGLADLGGGDSLPVLFSRDPNTIFRGNSLTSKCIDETMKLAGMHYLHVTLKPSIEEVSRGPSRTPVQFCGDEGSSRSQHARLEEGRAWCGPPVPSEGLSPTVSFFPAPWGDSPWILQNCPHVLRLKPKRYIVLPKREDTRTKPVLGSPAFPQAPGLPGFLRPRRAHSSV